MSLESPPRLAKVNIRGLFGAYDYALPGPGMESLGDTVILYGDNGSGKTTILQLIFHMLSPANDKKHRGTLYRIPFKYVGIQMSNGAELIAERRGHELLGAYDITVKIPDKAPVQCCYDRDFFPEGSEKSYISALASLNLIIYFLSDERQILSDTIVETPQEEFAVFEQLVHREGRIVSRSERPDALQQTLSVVNQWISRQAARGANAGDNNVNTIYTEIVRRLTEEKGNPEGSPDRTAIKRTLQNLSERSDSYAKYRFVSPLRADSLIDLVDKAPKETLPAIVRVLEPYIDGTKARLDALEEIQRITSVFVTCFSDFYSQKRVDFDVVDGLRVYAKTGRQLAPEQLSSGERQLVRLFCYTLVSRDRPSIFIIDEPELSLNIKWQRKLIRALNALVEGTSNQFLFATHSMEILAQHRRSVVPLHPSPHDGDPLYPEERNGGIDA